MADRGKQIHPTIQERIIALCKSQPIKTVARRLGLDRNTVRKYLRQSVEVSPPTAVQSHT